MIMAPLAYSIINLSLGFLLLQGFIGGPSGTAVNPQEAFQRATTPPSAFLAFNEDFSSGDPDRFISWIHPSYGLVRNGVLFSLDEASEEFRMGQRNSESGELTGLNVHFNFGEYVGDNHFQADCWVEYVLASGGVENVYRFHNIFVFRIINSGWYLVQSEYVMADSGTVMSLDTALEQQQNIPPELQQFVVQYSDVGMVGAHPWPLLLGSTLSSDTNLHPVEGELMNGRTWTLDFAVEQNKPTVLFFLSLINSSVSPERFDAQMEFLEGLYDTFGREDLYIFGTTDENREHVKWVGDSGYVEFAPLLDIGSAMHANMNIDNHPYIVVIDKDGIIVGIAKSHRPESWPLIEERIREVVAASSSG